MTPADDPFHPGGTFARYQILERIGEGGMASVWKAMHLGLRKPVAIKTLRADMSQSVKARERFEREGEAIARIRHAHVVEVHDVGIVGDTPYLVMEYLDGEDLRAVFLRRGALPLMELCDVMVPVCAAIAAAHDEGVVHRDLKPGNIFMARTRDRGTVPKVLDFGVSRLRDGHLGTEHTGTAVVLGTPRYMAPEQVRGARDVDGRADQYALGVMLYQGSTGSVPIDEPAVFELLRRVVNGDFAPPRVRRPDLPEAFERVVLRAMAKRPEDRFPTVRELGAALLPFASERTRVIYGDSLDTSFPAELLNALPPPVVAAPMPAAPPVVTAPAPHADGTVTLREVPLEVPARHSSPEVRALSLLLAAVAAVAVLLTVWIAMRPHATPLPPQAAVQPLAQPVEPVAQPVVQPVVQPIAQPVVQPIAQPIAQPVVQPIAQPVVQPMAQPIAQPVEPAVAQPVAVAAPVRTAPAQPATTARVRVSPIRPRVTTRAPQPGVVNAHDID